MVNIWAWYVFAGAQHLRGILLSNVLLKCPSVSFTFTYTHAFLFINLEKLIREAMKGRD